MPHYALWQGRSIIWGSLRQQLSNFYQISSNFSLSYISGICTKVGSSTKISAGPTLFQILQTHFYDVFHSRAATLIREMFCSMLHSLNPPFKILINFLRTDDKHTKLGFFGLYRSPSEQGTALSSPCLKKEQQGPTMQHQSHFAPGWCSCGLQVPLHNNFSWCCYFCSL